MKAITLLVAWAVVLAAHTVSAAPTAPSEVEQYQFEHFLAEFGKAYPDPVEYASRKVLFEASKDRVIAHNSQQGNSYLKGFNDFSDLSEDELRPFFSGLVQNERPHPTKRLARPMLRSGAQLPESFTWRTKTPSVLTPVKNQGHCGSCWAQTAVEGVESFLALKTKKKAFPLSTQQVTSCMENPNNCGGSGGCRTGTVELAWDYIKNSSGIVSEEAYPYLNFGKDTLECNEAKTHDPNATVTGYVQLEPNNSTAVMIALVNEGPLAVSVDGSNWGGYSSGVFRDPVKIGAHITINHIVQLVGYGVDTVTKLPYWEVRNSWGSNWGENGYIRLHRASPGTKEPCYRVDRWVEMEDYCKKVPDGDAACGPCAILYHVTYPIVELPDGVSSASSPTDAPDGGSSASSQTDAPDGGSSASRQTASALAVLACTILWALA